MPSSPLPPVPQRLREMLAEYPEYIQILQDDLIDVAKKKSVTPPFERTVWTLEDALSAFVSEARKELESAQAAGDPEAIAKAEAKERLMSRVSWKHVWLSDEALLEYFQRNKDAFRCAMKRMA